MSRTARSDWGSAARVPALGRPGWTSWTVLLALGLYATAVAPATADRARVLLRDGLEMRGDVELIGERVLLTNAAGQAILQRGSIQRIEWDEPPHSLDEDYARRTFLLEQADLSGHLEVARWAFERGRLNWAETHCRHVLSRAAEHVEAGALLDAIRRRASSAPAPGAEPPGPVQPPASQPEASTRPRHAEQRLEPPPLLSSRDVNRLRLYEIDPHGPPPPVDVRFERVRGVKDVDELVREELSRRPDADPEVLRILDRGRPNERLQVILRETGMTYADRILVRGDPPGFAQFRRRVLPEVLKGCTRSGCHSGDTARAFRLPRGSSANERFVYTVFWMLDGMQTPLGPMIDRGQPERSALLRYMTSPEAGAHPHPDVRGQPFRPPLRSVRDRRYLEIVEWIAGLRFPHPDYELEYEPPDWLRALHAAEPEQMPAETRPAVQPP